MITRENGDQVFRNFRDVSEMLKYFEREEERIKNKYSHSDSENPEWAGTRTWREAETLAKFGVPELGLEIQKQSRKMASKIITKLKPSTDTTFDKIGQAINVGLYLSGEPDCWVNNLAENGKEKYSCLVISGGFLMNAAQKEIENRGIAAAALALSMEAIGISTEIRIVWPNVWKGRIMAGFTFKEPSQPFSINQLAFFLAHPSGFRRIGFAALETLPQKYTGSGGNHATRSFDCFSEWMMENFPKNSIFLGGIEDARREGIDLEKIESCQKWIEDSIKKRMESIPV